jgi:predicted DNA-binding transcriptional regulator AlpA
VTLKNKRTHRNGLKRAPGPKGGASSVARPALDRLAPADVATERVLSTRELLTIIPLTRVTLWRLAREGRFVKPIQLTANRIGYRLSSVLAWLSERETHPLEPRAYFNRDRTR